MYHRDRHKRALRRHHRARLKAKRLYYYGGYIGTLRPQQRRRHLGILARTAKLCSCWICGNPRRYLPAERTNQERCIAERERCGWAELYRD
ncbi:MULTISPECIES: hypothetical protein [unclassified Microbulbifer]|uniref:hypothetical protein n=1 Tax=unclassified Microbulbifer TaxID=2619833 RepID=UPI0027E4EE54|nr:MULTISPECIES: hypothetical protein [unclassified Microbulbifer]